MPILNVSIEDLSAEHVLALPVVYDWTAWHANDSEERPWSWAEAVTCPGCERSVVAADGSLVDHNVDDDDGSESCPCSGDHVQEAEGPMMSYWYPCRFPGDMIDAAGLLAGLPLCAVTVDDEEGITLTGGGMDLSWEICEAYIRLGCLPPIHFARDLPGMGGMRLGASTLSILNAAERSLTVARLWIDRGIEDVARHRRTISTVTFGPGTAKWEGVPEDELVMAGLLSLPGTDADATLDLHGFTGDGQTRRQWWHGSTDRWIGGIGDPWWIKARKADANKGGK